MLLRFTSTTKLDPDFTARVAFVLCFWMYLVERYMEAGLRRARIAGYRGGTEVGSWSETVRRDSDVGRANGPCPPATWPRSAKHLADS